MDNFRREIEALGTETQSTWVRKADVLAILNAHTQIERHTVSQEYTPEQIDAVLMEARKHHAEGEVRLVRTQYVGRIPAQWETDLQARLDNQCALVGIIEQLRADLRTMDMERALAEDVAKHWATRAARSETKIERIWALPLLAKDMDGEMEIAGSDQHGEWMRADDVRAILDGEA